MNKRGLSTVLTTLIIILLVLVAVGIVWSVIKNLISESTEEVSFGAFTVDLKIKTVYAEDENIGVVVKRNPGKGNLTGIKFIFYEGDDSKIIEKNISLKELEEKKFLFSSEELEGLDILNIDKVSIASVLRKESGKESVGNVVDTYEIKTGSEESSLDMAGLILWNKLGSDAEVQTSEIGVDGAITGILTYPAGMFGSCSYSNAVTSGGNWMKFESFPSSITNDWRKFTIEFWFKTDWAMVDGTPSDGVMHGIWSWSIDNHHKIQSYADSGYGVVLAVWDDEGIPTGYYGGLSNQHWTANEFHHMAIVVDQDGIDGTSDHERLYIDGINSHGDLQSSSAVTGNEDLILLGWIQPKDNIYSFPWDGTIDNLKIWNYAKTDFSDRFSE